MTIATGNLRQNASPLGRKALAIALGLAAVGWVAITLADQIARPLHQVVASTVQPVATVTAEPTPASPLPSIAAGHSEAVGMTVSAPRECRLDQGIVEDCTFE